MPEWQEYRIQITPTAEKHLRELAKKLGKTLFAQLETAILELRHDPLGKTQKLYGRLAGYRSLHVSRSRVIVKIDDVTVRVYVVAAGWHTSRERKDVYQELTRLLEDGGDPLADLEEGESL